jgi:hypothetical protein
MKSFILYIIFFLVIFAFIPAPVMAFPAHTVTETGVFHVTPESSAFAITGSGRIIIFELQRDYTDTLAANARLLSVEVKYVRSQTY